MESSERSRVLSRLSRRERQIMEIIYSRGSVSAGDVQDALSDAPGYSAVRSALRLLEQKGLLKHRTDGLKYIYEPIVPGDKAGKSALQRVVETFFQNSPARVIQTLLSQKDYSLSEGELAELEKLIAQAKERERK
jgi:predicted transcriptional regulator